MVHGGPAGVFVALVHRRARRPIRSAGFATPRLRGAAVQRAGQRRVRPELPLRANYRDWGGGDYRDILSGVDALVAKGVADPIAWA